MTAENSKEKNMTAENPFADMFNPEKFQDAFQNMLGGSGGGQTPMAGMPEMMQEISELHMSVMKNYAENMQEIVKKHMPDIPNMPNMEDIMGMMADQTGKK